jgi:hypothetical protein
MKLMPRTHICVTRNATPPLRRETEMNLLPHITLGRFLGITEMIEKGLTTPAQFIDAAIRLRNEYLQSKADPEPAYKAQAEKIKTMYNALAKREGLGEDQC